MKYYLQLVLIFFMTPANAGSGEIKKVIEDFRLGMICLENETEWSKLFLYDSITWSAVGQEKTVKVPNFKN
ncbi:MAG: hypothetical protein AAF969_18235, partial [Bacteroidota bacterium]